MITTVQWNINVFVWMTRVWLIDSVINCKLALHFVCLFLFICLSEFVRFGFCLCVGAPMCRWLVSVKRYVSICSVYVLNVMRTDLQSQLTRSLYPTTGLQATTTTTTKTEKQGFVPDTCFLSEWTKCQNEWDLVVVFVVISGSSRGKCRMTNMIIQRRTSGPIGN